ncbi:hypothetical protein AB0J86_07130 [Micromonospora sp. NPDC049559]|uniref:hypothetical protein n=1 Tax=Micromonospora sp. NPDC049559 TaxID=3155923 RepID=UPI00341297CA
MRTGTRGRIRRIGAAALAAVAATMGLDVVGAAPARALGAGRVCLFNATEGAGTAGHVGWAFRVGTADDWIYGATENADWSWRREGNWSSALATFDVTNGDGYYDHYRCRDTPSSSVGAAKSKVDEVYGRAYHLLWDNCLTRSVEIFKAYDGALADLPYAGGTGPNWYYDNSLVGFGGRAYL